MKLNPNKRIGKVLYLVEGDVDEVNILRHIFSEFLQYTVVSYDKRTDDVICLSNPRDRYSKVFIVPMKYSAVSKIETSQEYIEYVYLKLKSFGLEKDECAKYLIFDRDKESNTHRMFEHLFEVFKNSLDNDLEINGLLLTSYPCVQSFVCQCFGDDTRLSSSLMMKQYISRYDLSEIKDNELLVGADNMIKSILQIVEESSFDKKWLDDMANVNKSILLYQDDLIEKTGAYKTLSLLFLSLIDLGIIDL